MKNNGRKYLIYFRYILPIVSHLIIFVMLFVPSYRFIFSGKAGELMSSAKLISNSWDQVRNTLFGAAEQTGAAMIFSKTLFAIIIIFAILFLLSLAVSIYSAVVAFRYFLSGDEKSAEEQARVMRAFIPNRIVLCILSSLGMFIASMPYLMKPLYAFTYSQQVTVVLEAPDALIVGGVFVAFSIALSIICAPIERAFDADIFPKRKKASSDIFDDEEYDESDSDENKDGETNAESNEYIRRLFYKEDDSDKK